MRLLLRFFLLALVLSQGSVHFAYAQTSKIPSLTLATPRENDTILGTNVTVSFVVGNFVYIDFSTNKKNMPLEGHVHIWLDQDNPTSQNANQIITHDEVMFRNLPPGNHTVEIEVVKNDHSSYTPRISKKVTFKTILVSPTSTPTPTPENIINKTIKTVTKEQLFIADGLILAIIGFAVFVGFGKKKFLK